MLINSNEEIILKYDKEISREKLVNLFKSVGWKTAEYPNRLHMAIKNSDYVVSAWCDNSLVGLISAISDGTINVFITYLLVSPEFQKKGIGKILMEDFCKSFEGFGRRILSTEIDKEKYYKKFGFNVEGIVMFNKDWKEDL